MPRWTVLLVVLLLAAACTPGAAPTPTPAKTAAPPAATATKPAAEPTKPAPAATPTVGAQPAATATPVPKPAVKPLEPAVMVKIGGTGSLTEAYLYIADAKGYFAQEGLKAEFIRFRTAADMVAPLGTGELSAGGGSPSPGLFNAIARGIPLKIVADRSTSLPGKANLAILVRKDLIDAGTIKELRDLKGKTIAINATGSSTEIALEKALEKGGVKRDEVNVVTMPFPDMLPALGNKAIDVAIDVDPYNALAQAQGLAVRWKGEDEVYPNHNTSVLLVGKFAQDNPEAAKRLVTAYVRGIRDYVNAFYKNIGKAEIISILTKATDITDPALFDKMNIIGVDPDGRVNVQSISADHDWYFAKGLMPQKVDVTKVVDHQYVEYAVERLGKYQP